MINNPWSNQRRVVPRWRTLEVTLQAGELRTLRKVDEKSDDGAIPIELAKRLERWRADPSLLSAGELVETAIVTGRENVAVRAARRLLQVDGRATPLLKEQAGRLLLRAGESKPWFKAEANPQETVSIWRARTRLHPGDALAWTELALQYTINNRTDVALKSMLAALQLAPDNRHVLRSAVRFFLHLKDRERAHDLLIRSSATKQDPWLLAAELATAEIAARSPRFAKIATKMLADGGLYPRQTTEMAAAIATLEMVSGNRKKAKRAFESSMIDPTGNAVAQAEWASPQFGGVLVPDSRLASVSEPSEALAFHRFAERRFSEVPEFCEAWANEEPYSIRPYEFGSTAAGAAGDYEVALDLAVRGLKRRPGAAKLGNSAAFALASMNRTTEATAALATIDVRDHDDASRLVALANRGLIAFREGRVEEGAAAYKDVMEGFRRQGARGSEVAAKIYYAREAEAAGLPEAQALIDSATEAWSKLDRHPHHVLERMRLNREAQNATLADPAKPLFSVSHRVRLQ